PFANRGSSYPRTAAGRRLSGDFSLRPAKNRIKFDYSKSPSEVVSLVAKMAKNPRKTHVLAQYSHPQVSAHRRGHD
ncbi:MAG: hypothetical protein KY475_04790, partial [Planctomycetes bacterium]|nr:hypothetical protein [Planctomycetota bacterium]